MPAGWSTAGRYSSLVSRSLSFELAAPARRSFSATGNELWGYNYLRENFLSLVKRLAAQHRNNENQFPVCEAKTGLSVISAKHLLTNVLNPGIRKMSSLASDNAQIYRPGLPRFSGTMLEWLF